MFLIPLMPVDPITTSKFQPSDIISLALIISIPYIVNKTYGKVELTNGWKNYLKMIAAFIMIATLSSIFSPFNLNFVSNLKLVYLFLPVLASILVIFSNKQKIYLFKNAVIGSFSLVLICGIIGFVIPFTGISTPFNSSSSIIKHALPFLGQIYLPPRIISLMKPTSNVLALYITIFCPIVLHFLRRTKGSILGKKKMIIGIYTASIIVGLFTYSRAVLPLLLVPVFLNIFEMRRESAWFSFIKITFTSIFLFSFIFLQIFTVLYPTNFKYSSTAIDQGEVELQKEIIDFDTDKHKERLNPIYFSDNNYIGSQKLNLSGEVHINHYAWLKISAIARQPIPVINKLLGFGTDSYTWYMDKYSKLNKELVSHLRLYAGSQSQIFTSIISYGILGSILFMSIIILPAINILLAKSKDKVLVNNYGDMILYATFAIVIAGIDMDFLNLRFMWSLIPTLAVMNLTEESI